MAPLRFLLATVAGFVNRQQAKAIAYVIEENRVLREQLGDRRLRLTDDQRRRLAARGKVIGRKMLGQVATIVTPDTILRWHRRLIAAKHTYPHGPRVGRPGLMKTIRKLIVRMATENSSWGYCRIQGEMKKLGHHVARTTIAKALKDSGVPPSPERPTSWRTFLRGNAEVIAATDFFTVDVWTARGLLTHYVLFVIHHATRAVEIAGVTTNPNAEFMAQVARNLTDPVDGFLRGKRFLILDRDTKFTEQFRRIIEDAGVRLVPTAYQAPDMNAFAERWVQSVKSECLNRMILFGERHLRRVLAEYVTHYHRDRPHQGIGNELITPPSGEPPADGEVIADERLGGLLRSYRYAA
ncbi:MAG: integrase core domain-containing protein [Planctomycetes bacterium]|nr:integrase core domain-containing protein [Planctomycetota bacterium]